MEISFATEKFVIHQHYTIIWRYTIVYIITMYVFLFCTFYFLNSHHKRILFTYSKGYTIFRFCTIILNAVKLFVLLDSTIRELLFKFFQYFFYTHNPVFVAYHSPRFSIKVNTSVMDIVPIGYKKDVGETSLLIPLVLAFALPIYQDKQLSQPTPNAYYKGCMPCVPP